MHKQVAKALGLTEYAVSILRLNSAALDENYIKMIFSEEERLQKAMPVEALIVLSVLKTERRAALKLLSLIIQRSLSDTRSTVEWLTELGMVEGIGNGSARQYMLSSKVYSLTNNKAGYTRQRGWDTLQEREMISVHLKKYNKITREDIVELCRCTPNHASWLLRQLVKDEVITLCGIQRQRQHFPVALLCNGLPEMCPEVRQLPGLPGADHRS